MRHVHAVRARVRMALRALTVPLSVGIALVTGAAARGAAAQPAPQPSLLAQGRTLNHVSLAVSDVEASAAFYQAVFGLKVVSRPGNGGINLGLGDGFLHQGAAAGLLHHGRGHVAAGDDGVQIGRAHV